jgi:hypothetical protein
VTIRQVMTCLARQRPELYASRAQVSIEKGVYFQSPRRLRFWDAASSQSSQS